MLRRTFIPFPVHCMRSTDSTDSVSRRRRPPRLALRPGNSRHGGLRFWFMRERTPVTWIVRTRIFTGRRSPFSCTLNSHTSLCRRSHNLKSNAEFRRCRRIRDYRWERFRFDPGSSAVTFNGIVATSITSWNSSSIVAVVPSGATTGNVVVTVGLAICL